MPGQGSGQDGGTNRIVLDYQDLGSLNLPHLRAARRVLLAEAEAGTCSDIEVDVQANRVGAAFIGVAVAAEALSVARGRRLRLRVSAPQVRRLFTACGLAQMLL